MNAMRGPLFWTLVVAALVVAPTRGQTLDVTTLHGRVYNIATGAWTVASVPGVEFCAARVTIAASAWFDLQQQHLFEHDWSVSWSLLESHKASQRWRDRLTVTITGAVYFFRELGTDRVWMVDTRYRVLGRD